MKAEKRQDSFVRFGLRLRVEHIALMVTFVVLAVTGVVQRFYTVDAAQWLVLHMGGIETTRLIHRGFAVVLTLGMIYHFAWLVYYMLFVRNPRLSMLPTLQDCRDTVTELKHSLGLKARDPQFGRYDYRQKFEYVGLVIGSMILIITGFMLAFPVAVTRLLPGQVVAAALEFHGNEATLAVLVILIWHLYDVILKPGIFPADTTMFTGRISRKRMMAEHYLEYAELTGADPVRGDND